MSIAELIMQGTNRASESTSWVGDSLAKLGQNVGASLAQQEQQKQAQEMLPYLQQSMQESMKLAGEGKSGDAYAKLIPFLTDPSVSRNPFLMQSIPALENGIKIAADNFLRKEQIRVQEGMYNQRSEYNTSLLGLRQDQATAKAEVDARKLNIQDQRLQLQREFYNTKDENEKSRIDIELQKLDLDEQKLDSSNYFQQQKTGGGGEDRSIYTPKERADMKLLGQDPPDMAYQDQGVVSDTTAVSQPTSQQQTGMPAMPGSSPKVVEVPLPEQAPLQDGEAAEMTYKGPQVKAVENMAASIKSPEYKKALLKSIKNPAPKEQVASFKQFSEQYNSLQEDGKMAVMQDLSVVFDSDKNFEKNKPQLGKNFYPLKPEQSAVIGNNITGIILEPTTEAKSMTAGAKSDSVTFGTNKSDIDAYQTLFTSATSELSQGELGKFLKENGGVFNTTYTETPSEVIPTMGTPSGKKTIPGKANLYQKNLDPKNKKTPVIELTDGQLAAFKTIQNSPSRLQQLRAGNSNSAFVRIAPSGPIRGTDKATPQASVYKSKEDVISAIRSNKLTREQGKAILQNQFDYK